MMQIFIKTLDGLNFDLLVKSTDTTDNVKGAIQRKKAFLVTSNASCFLASN